MYNTLYRNTPRGNGEPRMIKMFITRSQVIDLVTTLPVAIVDAVVAGDDAISTPEEIQEIALKLMRAARASLPKELVEVSLEKKEFDLIKKAYVEYVKEVSKKKAQLDKLYEGVNQLHEKLIRADMEQNRER